MKIKDDHPLFAFRRLNRLILHGNLGPFIRFLILFGLMLGITPLINPVLYHAVFNTIELGNFKHSLFVCLLGAVFVCFMAFITYLLTAHGNMWIYRIMRRGSRVFFSELHDTPYDHTHKTYDDGDIYNRITSGVDGNMQVWAHMIVILSKLTAVFYLAVMGIRYGWWLIAIMMLMGLADWTRLVYEKKKTKQLVVKEEEFLGKREELLHLMGDELDFFRMVEGQGYIKGRYDEVREKYWDIRKQHNNLGIHCDIFTESFSAVFQSLLYLLLPAGLPTAGKTAALSVLFDSLRDSVQQLRGELISVTALLVPSVRLQELFCGQPPELNQTEPEQSEILQTSSCICFEHVSYYAGEKAILKDVSFEIKKGEKVAVIGENGGGKTTLLRLVLGLYVPDDGRIWIDQNPRTTWKSRDLQTSLSYAPAENQLFTGSVIENMNMGKEETASRTGDYLGLENFLNAPCDTISYGQAKRVNLIRGIQQKGPVFVADEPLASLDLKCGEEVLKALLKQKDTVLITLHEYRYLKYFDRVLVVGQKKVVSGCQPFPDRPAGSNRLYPESWG